MPEADLILAIMAPETEKVQQNQYFSTCSFLLLMCGLFLMCTDLLLTWASANGEGVGVQNSSACSACMQMDVHPSVVSPSATTHLVGESLYASVGSIARLSATPPGRPHLVRLMPSFPPTWGCAPDRPGVRKVLLGPAKLDWDNLPRNKFPEGTEKWLLSVAISVKRLFKIIFAHQWHILMSCHIP